MVVSWVFNGHHRSGMCFQAVLVLGIIVQIAISKPICSLCERNNRESLYNTCKKSSDCGNCKPGFEEISTFDNSDYGKRKCREIADGVTEFENLVSANSRNTNPQPITSISTPKVEATKSSNSNKYLVPVLIPVLATVSVLGVVAFVVVKFTKRKKPRSREPSTACIELRQFNGTRPNGDSLRENGSLIHDEPISGRQPIEDDDVSAQVVPQQSQERQIKTVEREVTKHVQKANEKYQESIPINRNDINPCQTFENHYDQSDETENVSVVESYPNTVNEAVQPTAPPESDGSNITNVPSDASISSQATAQYGDSGCSTSHNSGDFDRYSLASTAVVDNLLNLPQVPRSTNNTKDEKDETHTKFTKVIKSENPNLKFQLDIQLGLNYEGR